MKCKHVVLSNVEKSHRNFVADIQFIPKGVKVLKQHTLDGRSMFCITCSEDSLCLIWDTKQIEKEEIKIATQKKQSQKYDYEWTPVITISLYRSDGSGEVGLSRMLFHPKQETPTFFGSSDEGDLLLIDWTVKPATEDAKVIDYVKMTKDSERNFRPVVSLARSPFFDDLILTVHDFHFALWKISDASDLPVFRSANTFEAHNTCGAFSPSRPGVVFIAKTTGIDVWDFLD